MTIIIINVITGVSASQQNINTLISFITKNRLGLRRDTDCCLEINFEYFKVM